MQQTTSLPSPAIPPTPIERITRPFQRFFAAETSGGIVLLAFTIVALIWANSPWAESYTHLWELPVSLGFGPWALDLSLHAFINDGLMAVFFFLVGLEIKREMLVGELASPKQAALPIAAALGGMLVPAGIYALLNAGKPGFHGWGIPMATDIAFALGVLALVARGAPLGIKVFLAALAIVDDLGAVLVIALFYTSEIHWIALALGGAVLALLVLMNVLGVRRPAVYALLGIVLWALFLKSGVHATIAGVLLAMTIPARTRIDSRQFLDGGRALMDAFDDAGVEGRSVLTNQGQQTVVQAIETSCEQVQAPLQRIEHVLQRPVAFLIIPLFALSNAGVSLGNAGASVFAQPVTLGVILGLVLGKPIGISLFSWLSVRSGLASLPEGVNWRHIRGVSFLGGIGFTMSLFIAGLAFESPELLVDAKVGILAASAIAALLGWAMMRK
jgi:NhaA family Na+:H+ antiporter